jgi:hypothetical protein
MFSRVGVIVLVASLTPVAAWIARNTVVCSLPRLTSVEAGNLVYFVGAGAYELHHHVPLEQAQAMIAAEFVIAPYALGQNVHATNRTAADVDAELRRAAPRVLAKYPGHLLAASVLGVIKATWSHATADLAEMLGRTWVHPGTSQMLRNPRAAMSRLKENGPLLAVAFSWQLFHTAGSLAAALAGIVAMLKAASLRSAGVLCLLTLGYFYFTLALFGLEAFWRCRIPVLPFLYAFSGLGLACLYERFTGRRADPRRHA